MKQKYKVDYISVIIESIAPCYMIDTKISDRVKKIECVFCHYNFYTVHIYNMANMDIENRTICNTAIILFRAVFPYPCTVTVSVCYSLLYYMIFFICLCF